MKKKFENIRSRGLKIALGLGILLLAICLLRLGSGIFNFWRSGLGSSALCTCGGVPPELSRSSPVVKIGVSQTCYSVVMVAPSANSRVDIFTDGAADACFRKDNRCVAWAHKKRNRLVEVTRKDIPKKNEPEYTAVLIKGDPGEVVIRLSR